MNSLKLHSLRQAHLDWLTASGVEPEAIINPDIIEIAHGTRGADGIFEPAAHGPEWFAFQEENDRVLWRPRSGELATEHGRCFALGEVEIRNPGVTALRGWLQMHPDPLEWLRARRRGIVVIKWHWCFEQLRDVARISVHEDVLDLYRKHMRARLPQLGVIPSIKRAAA
jgi:hypothetical protein